MRACKCKSPPPKAGKAVKPVDIKRSCPEHGAKARPDIWKGLPTEEHYVTVRAWNGLRE